MHIAALPGLQIEGVFTHYTDADLPAGDAFNKHQIALFDEATDKLRARGLPACITTDGPSGIRVRQTVALLPCGTGMIPEEEEPTPEDPTPVEEVVETLEEELPDDLLA